MFTKKQYDENQKRVVNTRTNINVPAHVQQFFIELLNHKSKRSDFFQTCITCNNFDSETETCKLVNQRPPARVIADGCSSYKDKDEMPF
jgi:hypothetical protein